MGRRGRDRKKKRDKEQEKKCLHQIQDYLRGNLVMDSLITPLLSATLISDDDSQRLDRETRWTTADQVDFLLKILNDSKELVLETFIQVLRENDHGHVVSRIQQVKASLSPSNMRKADSSTDDERTERMVIAIPRTVSRTTVIKIVPDDAIMKQIMDIRKLPFDEWRSQQEKLMALLRERKSGCGMILLYLQEALQNLWQDDLDDAETKANICLEMTKKVDDASKRKYLAASALCFLSAVNRNLKRLGNAQTYIDLARQELSTLDAGELEAEVLFTDGRLAMDIFVTIGSKEAKSALARKAIQRFDKVLSIFQDCSTLSLWWPSIRQQCLLNMASCYIRYPGGEKRCLDTVSEQDMLDAHKCLFGIRSTALIESINPRTLCQLIRTEGDLFFRDNKFQCAIDKLNEAKCMAIENGLHSDVRYCEERLQFVEARANKFPSPFIREVEEQTAGDHDADVSNVESSGEEFQSSETGAYNDGQICEAMSNMFLLCPEQEAIISQVTKSSNTKR